ncbi:hypothetical protein [Billgrantia kenyensis]|uniref:Uncharacterized protein n=1 Tax=Billgrantia kenyensis TaxID=321266 RepID=A0A7V9VYR2_9GAMM|nr:hypothetical protein [Halomonas kenyensis]MBA2777856.1 hypothetical protein [Halomonas kenyensis]MCG6661327.1 hypothetical protein [Halomonas kenyensis]
MKRMRQVVCTAWLVGLGGVCSLALAGEPAMVGFDDYQRVEVGELEAIHGREGFKNLINVQSIQNLESAATGASFTAGTIISGNINIEANAMDRISGITLMNLMTGHANAVSTGVSISIYAPQ